MNSYCFSALYKKFYILAASSSMNYLINQKTYKLNLMKKKMQMRKALTFCKSEVEKAIKEMKDKKVTGDDDVPGDALLGENGLRLMTRLISKYETGKWLKDFTEVPMTVLKKQPKATK